MFFIFMPYRLLTSSRELFSAVETLQPNRESKDWAKSGHTQFALAFHWIRILSKWSKRQKDGLLDMSGFSLDKDSVQLVKEAKMMVSSTCRRTIEFQFDDLENLKEQESDLRPMETKCSTVDE